MVHRPAVVDVGVERHVDHPRLDPVAEAERLEGAGEVDPVEHEKRVGLAHQVLARAAHPVRRRAGMQRVAGREGSRRLEVGHHARAQHLGETNAAIPALPAARDPPDHHHRAFGGNQRVCRPGHRVRRGVRRLRRLEARGVRDRHLAGEPCLLEPGVEADIDRAARRSLRHDARAQHGLDDRFRRARLVVPLDEIPEHHALVLGGVDPVDPRPAQGRIDRPGRAHDIDRRTVAPGVEHRHQTVHQPDIGMHDRPHRLVGHLGVAMGDRDRVVLVQAEQHLRVFVAEIVHDRIVEPAIAGARVERDVFDAEPAQHLGRDVAGPFHLAVAAELRAVELQHVHRSILR